MELVAERALGGGPALVGRDRVLDPWPETADEMLNPLAIGYAYDV